MSTLLNPGWMFTKDQWEPQMWAKVLKKIGEEGMIYCSPILRRVAASRTPCDTRERNKTAKTEM